MNNTIFVIRYSRRWRFEYQPFVWPCCLYLNPEDGGSKVFRNAGILPQHYTVSQPRIPPFEAQDL